jgi:hypothetical protein
MTAKKQRIMSYSTAIINSGVPALYFLPPWASQPASTFPILFLSIDGPIEHSFEPLHLYALWVQVIDW